jgi:hypothetical protein
LENIFCHVEITCIFGIVFLEGDLDIVCLAAVFVKFDSLKYRELRMFLSSFGKGVKVKAPSSHRKVGYHDYSG